MGAAVTECRVMMLMPRPEVTEQFILAEEAGTPVQSVEVRRGDTSIAAVTECWVVMLMPEVTEQFILAEEAGMVRAR